MENQMTASEQLTDQAMKSVRLFRTQVNQGDEINTDLWKANFERHQRLLRKCGVSADAAVMAELSNVISSLTSDDELALAHLLAIRRAGSTGDVLTYLLNGRDSMLVPVKELDDALIKLYRMPGLGSLAGSDIASVAEVTGHIDGIIHARLCQIAAGL